MGIELVKLVFARHAAGLSHRALTVLGYMSLHALDKPNGKGQPARLYFAGWEPLALALGYDGLTAAAEEKIRRAFKELRGAGLVEPQLQARTGTRQSYLLQLGFSPTVSEGQQPSSPTDLEGQSPTVSEGQEPHRFGVHSPTVSEGPRTDQESCEDSSQDFITQASASVTGPRARGRDSRLRGPWEMEPHPHTGEHEDPCETCGKPSLNLIHRHPKERIA